MRQVSILKLDVSAKTTKQVTDFVAEETPLYLFVNNKYWVTILCSPLNLRDLAIGHLLSEGILNSIAEVDSINLREKENSCYVTLKEGINAENRLRLSKLHSRIIRSACGTSSPYQYSRKPHKNNSSLKVQAEIILNSVKRLNLRAELFRKTGGVHVAAIYRGNGAPIAMAEDVGRHNAVDKVIGKVAFEQNGFEDFFLASSGRLSGDMIFKAAKVGLPIVASLSAPLDSGIAMAKSANITLVGFVRGKRMNIYTAPKRIVL